MLQEPTSAHCVNSESNLARVRCRLVLTCNRERSAALPTGLFNWIGPFWKIPDTYALQHQSLDAYLFLRFLRMTVVIMFVGACITMPVYVPFWSHRDSTQALHPSTDITLGCSQSTSPEEMVAVNWTCFR